MKSLIKYTSNYYLIKSLTSKEYILNALLNFLMNSHTYKDADLKAWKGGPLSWLTTEPPLTTAASSVNSCRDLNSHVILTFEEHILIQYCSQVPRHWHLM